MSRLLQALRTKIAVVPEDAGMSTAEYCVGVIAVCGFAALLYHVLNGAFGQGLLESILGRVLGAIKL